MKALVLEDRMRLVCRDVPDPSPGSGEVLVRVKACGICGSDVHGIDGSTGRRRPPVVMGHEASGIIAEVALGVEGWKAGERVTFDSTVYCGACDFCRQGRVNLCGDRRVLGVSCEEYRRDGAFAEFVVVPQHILYALPDRVTFEQAALVEPLSIALHAVGRVAPADESVAVVIGAGVIGLFVIQVLKAQGGRKVIAVDIREERLVAARRLGADETINARSADVPAAVASMTDGRGADVAFEVVGTTATLEAAVKSVAKGGAVVLVGNYSPTVEFPLVRAVTGELDVLGSCASAGEYDECLEMIAGGRVNVDALISAVAPLAEGAEWFERLYKGESGLYKVILVP